MYNFLSSEKTFDIKKRTFQFSIQIINLVAELPKNTAGFAIGNQVIRSGTSIGANIEEAQNASSKKEFIRCMTISLKESRETQYWLKLIIESKIVKEENISLLLEECIELVKILTTIVKNSKS